MRIFRPHKGIWERSAMWKQSDGGLVVLLLSKNDPIQIGLLNRLHF